MTDLRVEKHYELSNDHIYELNTNSVLGILRDLISNEIIIPRIQRSISWTKQQIKELIVSLYKGLSIGEMALWDLNEENTKINRYRIVFNMNEKLPDRLQFLLDGFHRCSALCAVFLKDQFVVDENLPKIDLYYNIFKDIFALKEEITELDHAWINLKDTFNPIGSNSELEKTYDNKINLIYYKLPYEEMYLIHARIQRIFNLTNRQFVYSKYSGTNLNFVLDWLTTRTLSASKDGVEKTEKLKKWFEQEIGKS